MKNNKIKSDNRRALPKFLILVVVAVLVGGVFGFFVGKGNTESLPDMLAGAAEFFGLNLAPWLLVALAVILPCVCIPMYKRAKARLGAWDGEDEAISDEIELDLSRVINLTSAALIVSYFLIAAAYSYWKQMLDNPNELLGTVTFFSAIVGFLAILVECVLLQQRCVDSVKRMNPEKEGSIYDMKFQRKWLDSCDEAEKAAIGQCAFKAYNATNSVCSILALLLALGALALDISFLPSLVVCLIWLVNTVVYGREAIKQTKNSQAKR